MLQAIPPPRPPFTPTPPPPTPTPAGNRTGCTRQAPPPQAIEPATHLHRTSQVDTLTTGEQPTPTLHLSSPTPAGNRTGCTRQAPPPQAIEPATLLHRTTQIDTLASPLSPVTSLPQLGTSLSGEQPTPTLHPSSSTPAGDRTGDPPLQAATHQVSTLTSPLSPATSVRLHLASRSGEQPTSARQLEHHPRRRPDRRPSGHPDWSGFNPK